MPVAPHPWGAWLRGRRIARRATRGAAMNEIDRFDRSGGAAVINTASGETWERRGGTWHKTAADWAAKKRGA